MAIVTYFDASGDSTHSALAVGGFMARPEQWAVFSEKWQQVLASENVTELHMKEFAHSVGPFRSWRGDEVRRASFIKTLTDVIIGHTMKSVAATLLLDHYGDFDRVYQFREVLGRPYAFTAFFAMMLARVWRDTHAENEPISYVFESGDSQQVELLTILERLRLTEDFDVSFQPKRTLVDNVATYHYPLQACDFIAYENGKAWRDQLKREAIEGQMLDGAKARKSLFRIAPRERDLTWRFIDTGLLGLMCQKFRVPLRPRREAL